MNYHNITKCDLKNGEGVRAVLWVSGCDHYCKGCHNPQTWNKDSGILFDDKTLSEIYQELEKDYVSGLTISGGDPLAPYNREEILNLLISVKSKYPNKNIWCYTGYTYEEIKHLDHIKYMDVLVDGKYEESLSIPSPEWCGSSNQKIIRLNQKINS